MSILMQLPHFWQSQDGKSHRNMLQVEAEDPYMKSNFPKDGSLTIRLQDEEAQKAFKMMPQEALQVGQELMDIARDLMEKRRKLWESKPPYKKE